jgi:hypothetical protein
MPKLPKGFGRRKSSGNVLEEAQISPAGQTSFRVFERSDHGTKTFDGGVKLSRASPRGRDLTNRQYNEDNIFEEFKGSRYVCHLQHNQPIPLLHRFDGAARGASCKSSAVGRTMECVPVQTL